MKAMRVISRISSLRGSQSLGKGNRWHRLRRQRRLERPLPGKRGFNCTIHSSLSTLFAFRYLFASRNFCIVILSIICCQNNTTVNNNCMTSGMALQTGCIGSKSYLLLILHRKVWICIDRVQYTELQNTLACRNALQCMTVRTGYISGTEYILFGQM
jgi:hypothetical protein